MKMKLADSLVDNGLGDELRMSVMKMMVRLRSEMMIWD